MPWKVQPCALHALLAQGVPLQGAARLSRAWRGVPWVGISCSSSTTSPGSAPPWLLGVQVQQQKKQQQPNLARRWHLSKGSPLAPLQALGAPWIRLPQELLLLGMPLQQPPREGSPPAHQLLSKITLRATAAGGGGGGGGSSPRAHKDIGGSPENEPADHSKENGKKPNKSQQLKKVFKEYGAVGVAFHVGISLMSLGMFYVAVSSGVDIAAILFKLGFDEALVQSKLAAGTSAFVLAYAIHKLFAPVRISITLVSVPLLVRYFRKIGFFKPPAPNP